MHCADGPAALAGTQIVRLDGHFVEQLATPSIELTQTPPLVAARTIGRDVQVLLTHAFTRDAETLGDLRVGNAWEREQLQEFLERTCPVAIGEQADALFGRL